MAQTNGLENAGTILLLGCGKMGSAMLDGWLKAGIPPGQVYVNDPYPSDWLKGLKNKGLTLNASIPANVDVCILAIKPQMMHDALPSLQALGNGSTVFLSIAAGTTLATLASLLGEKSPIVRAMPNTPAAVGCGITALIGNQHVSADILDKIEAFVAVVGDTVRLQNEGQMDAVTGVSGSGPAYVFHLIETLAAAGEKQGLNAELAMKLAKTTVWGAGQLAMKSDQTPADLRVGVTSPNGTTAAALEVLMNDHEGFPALLDKGVTAAVNRSIELGKNG
ncbi:pyrroline-5-carboxylate reductase [Cohaesibacter gelatinilyticus]|uniref:Pyrroline-5-carboxylate reductase n=1 Tax=Cohaesibacter gelatinilyticus TaxID=372072 RepID=A0A285NCC4_9HYPH|nr:pyrroline-5-carboxylate reductase [Cohaesibacter gelatinilyticus]SNZ06587.1 pyrroline-5-carboxylate reductase [Cohaesibacter gelatinilyticus]